MGHMAQSLDARKYSATDHVAGNLMKSSLAKSLNSGQGGGEFVNVVHSYSFRRRERPRDTVEEEEAVDGITNLDSVTSRGFDSELLSSRLEILLPNYLLSLQAVPLTPCFTGDLPDPISLRPHRELSLCLVTIPS